MTGTDIELATSLGGDALRALVSGLREAHGDGATQPLSWRIRQLDGLERMLTEAEPQIVAALIEDLGRSSTEAWLGDIASSLGEVRYAKKHLRKWARPKPIRVGLKQRPASARIQFEPLGVVLIVGPWNYPFYLTLAPLVAAVAAGNCVVIKPSELAPATAALLGDLVPRYLDGRSIRVVHGDGALTQRLLGLGFDHVVFTGGTEVGRKIMAGAAPSLTPVTLELGGKCPVFVASDADLDVAARRIAWVKSMNSGQTCIAPDYVIADASIRDELVSRIKDNLEVFRGGQPAGQRIINARQYDRLASYIELTKGQVVFGGGGERADLRIEPTIILDPDPAEPCMTEEIFGPILPVVTYQSLDTAIAFVRAREKPLAVYVFARSKKLQSRVVNEIPAGGAVINHVAQHCLVPELPFGGVGASGMGAYHGRWGFEALSHRKSVLSKPTWLDLKLVYPPYTDHALNLMRRLL